MNLLDLRDEEYINLITYRKDKTPVSTPVWLSQLGDSIVITSSLNTGKVKRIKANGRATIYTTNQSGSKKLSEEIEVNASIVEDKYEKQLGIKAIRNKYSPISKLFMKGPDKNRAIIKLEERRR